MSGEEKLKKFSEKLFDISDKNSIGICCFAKVDNKAEILLNRLEISEAHNFAEELIKALYRECYPHSREKLKTSFKDFIDNLHKNI